MILATLLLFSITTKADVPRVQADELRALMDKGEAIAVDVRGSVPFEHGHIAGAVWMPLGLIEQRAAELPDDKLIVTYCTCKAEETSLEAALLLASRGFTRVAVLQGGFPAWTEGGHPSESMREEGTGRLAPPAAVRCDRNDLTVYTGPVRHYRRQRDKTVLVIGSETITLRHTGSDDASRFYLIEGTPFTPADWNRIERRKGELRPDLGAAAWVCADGTIHVDWRLAPASPSE
jgi:rhodanese-related sulfurtransferase